MRVPPSFPLHLGGQVDLRALRLREKLGGLATALGAPAPPLPDDLVRELAESPAGMPESLGVDLPRLSHAPAPPPPADG